MATIQPSIVQIVAYFGQLLFHPLKLEVTWPSQASQKGKIHQNTRGVEPKIVGKPPNPQIIH